MTKETQEHIQWILTRYPTKMSCLLPVLWALQKDKGYIGPEEVEYVSKLLNLSKAHIYGVISFYVLFKKPNEGKHIIWVCSTLPCALAGSDELCNHICKKLGVKVGETTKDKKFTVKKNECLAACDRAPCIQIDEKYYYKVTPEKFDRILNEYEI